MAKTFNGPDVSGIFNARCFLDIESTVKTAAIAELCSVTADLPTVIDSDALLKAILARERVISTGIGNGVAIPHARTASSS